MNAAIYYHPEAYSTSGPKLMGRNAAGESFLRGFLRYSKSSEFWVQVRTREHAQHFEQTVRAFGRNEPVKAVGKAHLSNLTQAGVVYYPGPGIGDAAWQRASAAHDAAWSLCGITHTTASTGVMRALADLIAAPVQPWDAVICTSASVRDNVDRVLSAQVDYLKSRLGIGKLVLPQLPVIPLGIHADDFATSPDKTRAARSALGIQDSALVVLFVGRLSFHAKAHPLAMYQALEKAARSSGKDVVLIECGWHANEHIAQAYEEAANMACHGVKVVTLDGRDARNRATAWAAADVFCSLSDNIQETFGITPIEAMAAGLPVVVADWDGYKDTVRDGVDGFRVPTLMPGPGLGEDLAVRHALEVDTYDQYCGYVCSLVAVDIEATARAFSALFSSAELRQKMGGAGRQRAREVYDWSVIIPLYEDLWVQLDDIRRRGMAHVRRLPHPCPSGMDPFYAFGSYPTSVLTPRTELSLICVDVAEAMRRVLEYRKLLMVNYADPILPTDAELESVVRAAAGGPRRAEELVNQIPAERQVIVFRSLVWLAKLGILSASR